MGRLATGSAAQRRLKLFFDGGSRPNPGRIEVAVVVRGNTHFFDDLGSGTSMDAEWLALLQALQLAQSLGERDFDLVGDCAHVIAQANGRSTRPGDPSGHLAAFQQEAAEAPPFRIRWIRRRQNLAGIALERRRALAWHLFESR